MPATAATAATPAANPASLRTSRPPQSESSLQIDAHLPPFSFLHMQKATGENMFKNKKEASASGHLFLTWTCEGIGCPILCAFSAQRVGQHEPRLKPPSSSPDP